MKPIYILFLIIASMTVVFFSCEATTPCDSEKSDIIFKVPTYSNNYKVDSVKFSGTNIQWFNASTSELHLIKPLTVQELQCFHKIIFYLGSDPLFTATVAVDIMSVIINDLVIHLNSNDRYLYLEEGYPMWIDNLGATTLRAQNKSKRTVSWNRFIKQLKKEGRLKE